MNRPITAKLRARLAKFSGSGLACPECGHGSATLDSRPSGPAWRRRRICIGPENHRFTTFEIAAGRAPLNFGMLATELDAQIRSQMAFLQQTLDLIAAAKKIIDLAPRS